MFLIQPPPRKISAVAVFCNREPALAACYVLYESLNRNSVNIGEAMD